MKNKEAAKQVLANWKFPILQEYENGSLVFRYKLCYVQINFPGTEDSDAVTLTMSGIMNVDDDRKMRIALRTCNELTCRMLQVKVYVDSDNDVVIAAEFFNRDREQLEFLMKTALEGLVTAKKNFNQIYEEQEEEVRLLEELDNED